MSTITLDGIAAQIDVPFVFWYPVDLVYGDMCHDVRKWPDAKVEKYVRRISKLMPVRILAVLDDDYNPVRYMQIDVTDGDAVLSRISRSR